jgi:endonuclease/exonuclease/phosphatase family metal-dependent hydrolase
MGNSWTRLFPAWWALAACATEPAAPVVDASTPPPDASTSPDAAPVDASSEADASTWDATSADASVAPSADGGDGAGGDAVGVEVELLSYNVAGLPEGLSGSMPATYIPLIGPRLNAYDLVAVQEDFAYHAELVAEVDHQHRTEPNAASAPPLGDGLSVLSRLPLVESERVAWARCFGVLDRGSDCLTPKGFLRVRLALDDGRELDLYDVHTDAGTDPDSTAARIANFAQLAEHIRARSEGHALIVLGDMNSRYTAADGSLQGLLAQAELRDVWAELLYGGAIPSAGSERTPCSADPNDPLCERIDKILVRDGDGVRITATHYRVDGLRFETGAGEQLSDHRPVAAGLRIQRP